MQTCIAYREISNMKYIRTRFPPGHKGKKLIVSFKKNPGATGLAAIMARESTTNIKINKRYVGEICPPTRYSEEDGWHVQFQVLTPEPKDNASKSWEWVKMKARFPSEPEAREAIKKHIHNIAQKHHLYTTRT